MKGYGYRPELAILALLIVSLLGSAPNGFAANETDVDRVFESINAYYNWGAKVMIIEEEAPQASITLAGEVPVLKLSRGLLRLVGNDRSQLAFAMAHQYAHAYSLRSRVLVRDPDWIAEEWNKAAREEEQRADRFAVTMLGFSADYSIQGARKFLLACARVHGEQANFCLTLQEVFHEHPFKVFFTLSDRAQWTKEVEQWLESNFSQTRRESWPQGVNQAGRKKLARDFRGLLPSIMCWPHC